MDDIFNTVDDIIVHQVNCQGVMGSGIAKQVKALYPRVFNAYVEYCKKSNILGTSLIVYDRGKYIANVFGQYNYGNGLQTNYNALSSGLKEVYTFAKNNLLSVAIPYKIGCGLGGGDWNVVSKIIESIFTDVPFYVYRKDKLK